MANNFSGAADCVFVGNFDNGALLTDSSPGGTNTLTNNGSVTNDLVNFKQGDASADLDTVSQSLTRTDVNMSSGFPAKLGTANLSFTACFWNILNSTGNGSFMGKRVTTNDPWGIVMISSVPNLIIGNGSAQALIPSAGALVTGRFYHWAVTYNGSNDAWTIRIWDDTAGSISHNSSGTSGVSMAVGSSIFGVGQQDVGWSRGSVDEAVVFNTVRSSADTDEIRAGTFGAAAGNPWGIYQQMERNNNGIYELSDPGIVIPEPHIIDVIKNSEVRYHA